MEGPSTKPFDAITFSGCGTLNFYQTGVAASLQEAKLVTGMSLAGASAGSGLATLVAAGVDATDISHTASDILAPFAGKNILVRPDILITFAQDFLASFIVPETLERIGERVHISITRLPLMRNWQVNRFTDIGDLCRAIRASCHIPSPRRRSVRFRGQACIDGGFSSNTPIVGERCLCVSPFRFSRQADIRPSDKLNPMRALLVPSRMQADDLFRRGRDDGKRFLQALADGAVHVKASAARRNVAKRVAPFLPRVP